MPLPPYMQVNLNDLYDLNSLNRETDTTAAERAIGGGFGGSPFARNFNAGLRFSEQQKYAQPYLDRQQQSALQSAQIAAQQQLAAQNQAGEMARLQAQLGAQAGQQSQAQAAEMQRLQMQLAGQTSLAQLNQGGEMQRLQAQLAGQSQLQQGNIAADAARQAVEQAGLNTRLNTEQQSRLALAIQSGNQSMQERILSEAGVTSRQATQLAASAREQALNLQQRSFEAILPYLQRQQDTRRATAPWQIPSQPRPSGPAMLASTLNGGAAPRSGSAAPATRGSSATGQAISKVDSILGMYGLGNGGVSAAPQGGGAGGGTPLGVGGDSTVFSNTGPVEPAWSQNDWNFYYGGDQSQQAVDNFTQEDWNAYYG